MASELDSPNEVVDQEQATEAITKRPSLATNEQFLEGLRIGLVAVKEVAGQRDEVLLRLEEKKAECAALRAELGGRMEELQRLSNRALQIMRTQARIGAWATSRWPDRTIDKKIVKLGEEYAELYSYTSAQNLQEEAADCAICLFDLAAIAGFDLLEAVEAKMLDVVAKHGGVWTDRDGKEHGK